MILPTVASLSEDAMSAVPQALREGAFALGSTRLQVATAGRRSRRPSRASSPPSSSASPGRWARR